MWLAGTQAQAPSSAAPGMCTSGKLDPKQVVCYGVGAPQAAASPQHPRLAPEGTWGRKSPSKSPCVMDTHNSVTIYNAKLQQGRMYLSVSAQIIPTIYQRTVSKSSLGPLACVSSVSRRVLRGQDGIANDRRNPLRLTLME